MQPRPSPLRIGPSGSFIEVDEAEELRAAAKARSRETQRANERADRRVEARERAEYEHAVAEQWRREIPVGFPKP